MTCNHEFEEGKAAFVSGKDGLSMIEKCAICGEIVETCMPHEYKAGTSWVSCTQLGVHMIYRCARCGKVEQVYIGPRPSPPTDWRVV